MMTLPAHYQVQTIAGIYLSVPHVRFPQMCPLMLALCFNNMVASFDMSMHISTSTGGTCDSLPGVERQ